MDCQPFEIVVIEESDNAWLIQFCEFDDQELWVPKSKIPDGDSMLIGFEGELLIETEWAQKRGLA